MAAYGILIDSILYIQVIILFVFIGILIYLARTTKLTHLEAFNQRFLTGLYCLLGSISVFIFIRYIIQIPPNFYNVISGLLFGSMVIFIFVIINGILKLKEYISSLIDFEEKHLKLKTLVYALILAACISILGPAIEQTIDPSDLILYVFFAPIIIFCFCFAAFYCFLLHKEIKVTNIKILNYFGAGIISAPLMYIPSFLLNIEVSPVYWIIINLILTILALFFLFGYLDLKKQTKKMRVDN